MSTTTFQPVTEAEQTAAKHALVVIKALNRLLDLSTIDHGAFPLAMDAISSMEAISEIVKNLALKGASK